MSVALNLSTQYTVNALQQLENVENGVKKAIADFTALKNGELRLEDLVVSDNGWEFLPPAPLPIKKAESA